MTTTSGRRCRVRGAAAAGCLLVAVMTKRSAAFLVAPGAFGVHDGRARTTMSTTASSLLSPSAFSGVGLMGGGAAVAERSSSRRRGAGAATGSLRMEFAPNPMTSRQYGRGDKGGGQGEKGSSGNPDINEEIMVRVLVCVAESVASTRCMYNKLRKK